jgi:hypothetical protein
MLNRTSDQLYRAIMQAYQRTVAAQELADSFRYIGLEEDLFQLSVELQKLAGELADGRRARSRRNASVRIADRLSDA